jgi:hypothetical protein
MFGLRPRLGEVRVGHCIFVRGKLHHLQVGVRALSVLRERASLRSSASCSLRKPLIEQRFDFARPGGRELDQLNELHDHLFLRFTRYVTVPPRTSHQSAFFSNSSNCQSSRYGTPDT